MIESKIEIKEKVEQDEYPKLMIVKDGYHNQGLVVLFDSKASGCIIKGVSGYANCEGEYIRGWDVVQFEDLHGTITLSNK